MDPWEHVRRAASDRRSGSLAVAERAAAGLAGLTTRRDRARAGRMLVRAHPAMALVRRLVADARDGGDPVAFVARARAESDAAADAIRWVASRRAVVVVTHSASGAVAASLERIRTRVALVRCTTSLPGGEGRAFARRLARDGFVTEVVPDAAIARACDGADLALVGADAVTENAVVNKVGTRLLALAAREAGVGCYAIACGSKLVPSGGWDPGAAYERTPLELFDAVVTERGAMRPAQVRRAVGRVTEAV